MQDITNMIHFHQNFGNIPFPTAAGSPTPPPTQTSASSKPFEFKEAVIIDAKPHTFQEYYRLFVKYSTDQNFHGIFWQQSSTSPVTGYIYHTKGGELQLVENDRVKQFFDKAPQEEISKYESKFRCFKEKFRDNVEKFTTYSSEAYFEKRNRSYKKLKK